MDDTLSDICIAILREGKKHTPRLRVVDAPTFRSEAEA
jgi:hypothetical protein